MLKTYATAHGSGDDAIIWIDLDHPTDAERARAQQLVGAPMPTRESLSEIEASSRLRARDGVLFMSMPTIIHAPDGGPMVVPVGFVLSQHRLVTVRFGPLHAADLLAQRFATPGETPTCSLEAFVSLCEAVVDVLADILEQTAAALKAISASLFRGENPEGRAAIRANRMIRSQLRELGRLGDKASEARDALLGIGRVSDYACEATASWADGAFEARMRTLRQDVASLDDYQVHLEEKVQFLLDAMVGLIGMAQNDIFKFLTIVSIAGIPPTVVVGVYGMNFHFMPELAWPWGYPFGLLLVALSVLIPLAWFKWRGWF
ncbi:magnesium transporter CorA family protein [Caulobacter sp. KR2-114]|uniref:magnesium transporter CorA family protein n=1 Tax=Caulobacter sp. KR2-114 TaxID=3400912 RepID=UPI003C1083BD